MDPKSFRNNKRLTLYAIGAGTLLLALMAFSFLFFGVIHVCGRWIAMAMFSFWEVLGISIISAVGFMLVRSWQRRGAPAGTDRSLSRRLRSAVEERLAVEDRPPVTERPPVAERPPVNTCSPNFRNLYDQLSEEERLELKAMMRKYCSDQMNRPPGVCNEAPSAVDASRDTPPSRPL